MPSTAYIFMLCGLCLATLFLYSELQLYFWSQPVAFLPFSHPSVCFPSLPRSFYPSFHSFILHSSLPSICVFVWLKAIQGRETLAIGLVFLELTLWETVFLRVHYIKMSMYSEMRESANLGTRFWQLWIWVLRYWTVLLSLVLVSHLRNLLIKLLIDKVLVLSDSSVKSVHALGLPLWLSGQNLPARAGDPGSIPGSGRSSGEGNGYPLQSPCLENPMDKGAWQPTIRGVKKSDTR